MRRCKKYNEFQKHILEIFCSLLDNKEITHIRNAFTSFDEDHSGTLSLEEFSNAIKKLRKDISDEEIRDIFERIKDESKNEITWTLF